MQCVGMTKRRPMTEANSLSEEEEQYDEGACSVIDSLNQIGSQWRLIVLHDLQDGEKRFNELKRSTGASSRTLSLGSSTIYRKPTLSHAGSKKMHLSPRTTH